MSERLVAKVTLPFDLRADWQRKLRFRDSVVAEVARQLRARETLDFERVMAILPLFGEVEISFDQIPALCLERGNIPREVDLQVAVVYGEEKDHNAEDGKTAFWRLRTLPSDNWDQYWHRIFVDDTIKRRALNYTVLSHKLTQLAVSNICLAQHRIVLLYGPPGTGKTTLVRGLANQAARIFRKRGEIATTYIEIDAHRLSSKWLGESQKLIEDVFDHLLERAMAGTPVICVFDEVESLLTNRSMTLHEGNPVDVYRAVNAVLQLVDKMSELPNIFTLATSNLTNAIDPAFADRVDLSFYVDVPTRDMRASILADIASELGSSVGKLEGSFYRPNGSDAWQCLLEATEGYSGRQLRKLVLEALSSDDALARHPGALSVEHLASVVGERQLRPSCGLLN